jgi:hypothetical protein
MIVLAAALVGAASAVTYRTATVDGNPDEWNLATDLYSPLWEAGINTKDVLAYSYMRYAAEPGCEDGTVYLLVLSAGPPASGTPVPPFVVKESLGDAWVAKDTINNKLTFTDFDWVYIDGVLRGYEASFRLPPNVAHFLKIHVNIVETSGGGRTASNFHPTSDWTSVMFSCSVPAEPAVQIVKDVSVDGGTTWFAADGTGVTGDLAPEVLECSDVMFRYTVTNPGDVDLIDVAVTDDKITVDDAPDFDVGDDDAILEPGEKWIYFETIAAVAGTTTNIGTVTAEDDQGTDVSDTNPAQYTAYAAAPALAVTKTLECGDSGTIFVGSPIKWLMTVKNTGNVPLTDIQVTDTPLAIDEKITLAAGAEKSYEVLATAVAGAVSNTITASITFTNCAGEVPLSESASAGYTGIGEPSLEVTKTLECGDGGSIFVGSDIKWLMTIKNTGTETLEDIVVTDTPLNINDKITLAPNEVKSYEVTGTAVAGAVSNTIAATVTVVDSCGTPKTASDDATAGYTGINVPVVTISKTTNGYDCGDVGAPKIYEGDAITWTYVVTNPGPVDVVVDVADDKLATLVADDVTIAAGTSQTFTRTGTAVRGPYENTATVTGTATDICGNPGALSPASDDSCYFGWSDDTLTGLGYKESQFNTGKTFATITKKGTWFMYLTVTPTSIPDGQSLTFDIQAGNPKNQLVDVGDITITRTGTSYTIDRVLDTNVLFAGDPYLYGLYLTDEHLAVDTDRTMSFTGKPGRDDMGYEYPYTFTDSDGYFFVFAHWGAAWGPTLPPA